MKAIKFLEASRFCPRCGHECNKEAHYLRCPQCGLHIYNSPKPCVSVLIRNSQGHYLLVERVFEPKKGFWDFPGGFVEGHESFEEAAYREVKEELGIDIGELRYLCSVSDTYDYQGIEYATLAVNFIASIVGNAKITPQDDVASFKFFEVADFPVQRIAFDSIKQVLSEIQTSKL